MPPRRALAWIPTSSVVTFPSISFRLTLYARAVTDERDGRDESCTALRAML